MCKVHASRISVQKHVLLLKETDLLIIQTYIYYLFFLCYLHKDNRFHTDDFFIFEELIFNNFLRNFFGKTGSEKT